MPETPGTTRLGRYRVKSVAFLPSPGPSDQWPLLRRIEMTGADATNAYDTCSLYLADGRASQIGVGGICTLTCEHEEPGRPVTLAQESKS